MITNQEPLSLAETKKLLEKLGSDVDSPRIKKTLEYLKKFSKRKAEKVNGVVKKLSDAGISKLKQQHIVKIVDIMPETPSDLRSIFFGEDVNLDSNETEKILQIIKESN